ncbi:MAG TPA: divalent metal cation transporter [Methylomirabilota bacterium]|jgi:NRAMP (natural resistance-associated macrophage protein)-like metal ion transporter|nr:divalent metal cation transporter [Methylomirabilota bacterium]
MKQPKNNKVEQFWHMLGPGLTTGAADDDPAGIATYSQAGASFGFGFLWTALFTFPFMAIVQEMCARIGLVTGRGLASAIRVHYSKSILYICAFLLFVANTFNLGADLGIMAKAIQLVIHSNFTLTLIFIAFLSLVLQIFTSYQSYAKVLKWLSLILFSYVITAFFVHIAWRDVWHDLVLPKISFNKQALVFLMAILGTTISPYLFFWQTSQEIEEEILEGQKSIRQRQITPSAQVKKMRWDVWGGMFLSNLVMFFIIVVSAATFYQYGISDIKDAAQAALALKPLGGEWAYLLFTLGIIGTGMLAVPILAGSSSYAISESFGWHEGLYRKYRKAQAFYGIIILSMFVGLVMNFLHLDAIKMLIYSSVLNGLIAPVILVVIVLLSSNSKIMKEWTNHPLVTFLGWLITIIMTIGSFLTIWFLVRG